MERADYMSFGEAEVSRETYLRDQARLQRIYERYGPEYKGERRLLNLA